MPTTTDQARQIIVLVKTTEQGAGHTGTRQETKHPADQDRGDAIYRAYQLLKRACPDEDPGDWTVQDEEGDDGGAQA